MNIAKIKIITKDMEYHLNIPLGINGYVDINIVKEKAKRYIKENDIKDIEEILYIQTLFEK